MLTKEQIENYFTYHPPKDDDQIERFNKLRNGAKEFALLILECTPSSADQTASIRKVKEAVMTANSAIACN